MNIPVLIIKTLTSDLGVNTVKNALVSNSEVTFTFNVQEGNDYYTLVKNFLLGVYTPSGNNFAMYIFDTSITNVGPDRVRSFVEKMTDGSTITDMWFLNRFLDNCSQYTDSKSISTLYPNGNGTFTEIQTGSFSAKTTGAKGGDAVLFSNSGMKKFLSDVSVYPSLNETLYRAVNGGTMNAYIIEPSIFEFNSNYATSNSDYVKSISCANFKSPEKTTETTSTLGFIIFILVIVLLLIVVWALFKVQPNPRFNFISLNDIKV